MSWDYRISHRIVDQSEDRSPSLGGKSTQTGKEPSIGGERGHRARIDGLASEDWQIRVRSAQEMARRGDKSAMQALADSLHDWNGSVRQAAAQALILIGPEAIPSLTECLAKGDPITRRAAVRVLSEIGHPAVPTLLEIMGRLPGTRRDIIDALGAIGDERGIPVMIANLGDPAPEVRFAATRALSRLGAAAAPALLAALGSDNFHTRYGACDLLGRVHYQPAVPQLIALMDDEQKTVRKNAVQALGEIGTGEAIDALLRHVSSPDEEVRQWTVFALGRVSRPETITALMSAASEDPSPDVRGYAVQMLGRLKAIEAIPMLGRMLRTETDIDIQDFIVRTLADIGHEDAVPFVFAMIGEDAPVRDIAEEVIHRLTETGHPLIVTYFRNELLSEYYPTRLMAIEALARIRAADAVPDLIRLLEDTTSSRHRDEPRICDAAANALEQIGTPEALSAVQSWRAEHPDDETL